MLPRPSLDPHDDDITLVRPASESLLRALREDTTVRVPVLGSGIGEARSTAVRELIPEGDVVDRWFDRIVVAPKPKPSPPPLGLVAFATAAGALLVASLVGSFLWAFYG